MIFKVAIYSHYLTYIINIKRYVMKAKQALLLLICLWSHALWAEGGGTEKETVEQTPPFIKAEEGLHELLLSDAMNAALKAKYLDFVAWKTTDYTPSLVEGLLQDDPHLAPFAFIMDINQDAKKDAVIDGVMGDKTALLAIISTPDGYQVMPLPAPQTQTDPKKITSMNDGVLEVGLSYLLWPNSNPNRKDNLVLTVAFPQETDAEGEVLAGGNVTDYHFIDGRFVAF